MTNKLVMMGATGAVGSKVVERLLTFNKFQHITLLGRRIVEEWSSDKVSQNIIDVTDPKSYSETINNVSIAICTLGIGEPSKTSKEIFIAIDKVAVLEFAKQCKANGVKDFHLLSSVGINSKSYSFYLRIKGELVDELEKLNFQRLSIYQPSMILTPTNRYGITQAIALKIWPWLNNMLVGNWKKYRGIKVEELGFAIANNAMKKYEGIEKLTWQNFKDLQ